MTDTRFATTLTPVQLAAFSADLAGNEDPTVVAALAEGNNNAILAWYTSEASPGFYLWRTSLPIQEMRDQHFDWGEIVDNLTTNALLSLLVLTGQDRVDPSRASIRAAFTKLFSSPQMPNTRGALAEAAKRLATAIQKLFATGGDGSSDDPALAVVESITINDVRGAVALIPEE